MIGELHRWEQLHAFIREMIRNPEFICRADDIVIEFGNSRLQELADAYVSGGKVTETQLQSLWRETAVPLTWNSPVYRQFYEAVREINQKHLCEHPIRIVLADPPLDWSKIKTAKDYEPWADRDASYADVVEREVLAKHHRAFLLAGQFHAVKQIPEGDEDGPRAAQLIERKHPGSLFSIVAVPSPAVAETMHMGPPPSFKVVRGSELTNRGLRGDRDHESPQKMAAHGRCRRQPFVRRRANSFVSSADDLPGSGLSAGTAAAHGVIVSMRTLAEVESAAAGLSFSERSRGNRAAVVGLTFCGTRVPHFVYSVRNASTGFSRLARRAGKRQANSAASARTAAVVISRTGLCAET